MTRLGRILVAALIGVTAGTPRGALAEAPRGDALALSFDGGNLLLATDEGLWRSADGGIEWTALPSVLAAEIAALVSRRDHPGRVLAGLESGGVILSEDGGESWTPAGSGLPVAPVLALAVAAQQADTMYASVAGDGLWQTTDAGATWSLAMDRPWLHEAEQDLLALASVDSPSGMGGIWVYAGTQVGLTRVPDCFCRWQEVQAGNAMDALAAGEELPPEAPLPAGEAVQGLAVAPDAPEVIFAATPSGIWRTTDAGVNWTKVSETPADRLAVDPMDPNHVVAATERGFLSSRNGGQTWAEPGA